MHHAVAVLVPSSQLYVSVNCGLLGVTVPIREREIEIFFDLLRVGKRVTDVFRAEEINVRLNAHRRNKVKILWLLKCVSKQEAKTHGVNCFTIFLVFKLDGYLSSNDALPYVCRSSIAPRDGF